MRLIAMLIATSMLAACSEEVGGWARSEIVSVCPDGTYISQDPENGRMFYGSALVAKGVDARTLCSPSPHQPGGVKR